MQIKDIKKIVYNNGIAEILIDIELDPEKTNRWELEDPNALIFYKSHGEFQFDRAELIDRGMKVHGYEFTEAEENQLCNFFNERLLKNSSNK